MATKASGKYIGDAAIAKLLEQHNSQIPFHVVRMRVLGAIASPNPDLLPASVIASFWPADKFPTLASKAELDSFFETFMGLWRRMEKIVIAGNTLLSAPGKMRKAEDATAALIRRMEELESGFIEGFWGGKDDLPMSSASAALIDAISDQVSAYHSLYEEVQQSVHWTEKLSYAFQTEVRERDEVVEDTIKALLLLKNKSGETQH